MLRSSILECRAGCAPSWSTIGRARRGSSSPHFLCVRDARGVPILPTQVVMAKDIRYNTTTGEELGEATGGISGALVGAGIGSAAGPVGTLIGGVAGAIGGWWAGRAVADSASKLTHEDEEYFREHYETQPVPPADLGYDAVRGAYYLGHIASNHPDLGDGEWSRIEPE